jgi:putative spermidine/putrescine transport system ATP-binding protein
VEIRSIQRQLGITTVYVTHDQEEALSLSDRVVVMSEGRMEQVGTPFEIYNFPSTPFVASFVGTLNVLPASIVDAGRGELTVAGQAVRIARRFEGGTGTSVNIALRPEMVKLGDGPDGSNRVKGKVIDVGFLGSIVRMRVAVGGENGPVVSLDEFNEPTLKLPAVGDDLTIHFPADGPLVLNEAPQDPAEVLIAQA